MESSAASAAASGRFLLAETLMAILLPKRSLPVPPTRSGIAYEPIAGMSTTSIAVNMPRLMPGMKIETNALKRDAPKSLAASIREKLNFSAAA